MATHQQAEIAMPSIERKPLNEVSSNLKPSPLPTKRPHTEPSGEGKQEETKTINRKTLEKIQTAAKLSPGKMDNLKTVLGNVDECDNRKLRNKVREWITMNVPHNKQEKVREEIFDTLYALVPPATRSRMKGQELCYRSGSMEPPGFEHMCPSDYGSDDEPHEAEKNGNVRDSAAQPAGDNGKNDHHTGDKDLNPPSKKRKTSNTKTEAEGNDRFNVSGIHLEGEENDAVPVFETCDMIRRKIDRHLKEPGVTQASFCRDLLSMYHSDAAPKHINSKYLSTFRGKKGYDKGNTSVVFYAAYCFFEKLRIKEGKLKSKDRLKMEELWAERGGFDTKKQSHNKGLFMTAGEGLKKDKYGQFTITRADGSQLRGVI